MTEKAREADSVVKEFFQGRWLGHPLHPMLVHVPTGLWPAALVFDVIAFARPGNNSVVQTSFWCIVAGLAVAAIAAPAGLADWADIKKEKEARQIGIYHMSLNGAVTAILLVSVLFRGADLQTATTVSLPQLLMCLVANAILAVAGYLGGRMVFEHGTSVARQSREEWRALAIAGGANMPDEA
jgi:uncharacterized membrane protein